MRRADCETDTMQDSKEDADKKSKPAKNNKERLRRLKENGFIEQLAEIISANYSDMNSDSPRPQKCSIMRKAINLIRVNQKNIGELRSSDGPRSLTSIISSDVHCPFLFEALDGFLILINLEGKIEFVSENVNSILSYNDTDFVSKGIFDIVHQEDRDHFQRCLASLPNATTSSSASSTNNSSNWGTLNADTVTNVALEMAGVGAATASLSLSNDSPSTSGMLAHCRSNSFTARFRRRSSRTRRRDDDDSSQLLDDEDSNDSPPLTESETDRLSNIDPRHDCIAGLDADVHMSDNSLSECPSDTKRPVRTDSFEPLLVSATWTMMPKITRQSIPTEAKEWTLFCFARRWPVNDFSPNSILIDHFSMRLHPNGSIIGIDLSGMPDLYLPYFGKELIGRNWNELICATDVHKWNDHVAKLEPNLDALTSEVYKVRPAVNTKFYVQTKSKRVGEGDEGFIMCYHLVIRSKEYGERLHRGLLDSSNDCMITHDRHTPTALTVNENHNYRNNMCSPTVSRGATTAPVFGGSFNCNGPQGLGSANDHSNSQQMLEPLPSSSNLGPESSSSNRLFEDFSPNAQSNPTDYNLNECLALNDMFPSSNWPDYDTSTNSMDVSQPKSNHVHTSNTTSETSSSTVDEAGKGNEKAQKLRNLLTQRSEPGSPSDEARKEMFDSQLAELTSNRNTLSSSAGDTHSPASRRNGSPTGSTNQPEKSRSNDILRELLHQEDDEDVLFAKTSHSDAVQRNFTCDPLASVESNNDSNMSVGASTAGTSSLNQSTVNPSQINSMAVSINSSNTGSSMCAAQLQPSSSSSSSLSCSSTSSTAAVSKSNGNNMLRKLLNDDDNGKAFRKGQDILIEQLFKENQSPVSSNNSLIESSSKSVGQMKRKSTEDHFSGQTIEAPANVSGSTIGSLLINSPVHSATTSETYQPIKRLSLSEPVKSSVPSPVQVRSTGPVMGPLSTMNVNSTTIPGSFRNVSTTTTVAATAMSTMNALSNMNAQQLPQQPQQLAGQNPMLAQMLAQTPKTLPLPPISIPTSIVSQVPQERLPKNLEKKLIHTPTTTTSPHAMSISLSASSAGCTMPNSTPSSLSFSMNGTIVSSSNHSHVPPSPLIQSTPIVVSSQLGSPNVGTYGGPPGGHMSSMSGHPQQFMMTTSGQFQPVKSIIVQTTAHPAGVEMGSQTQGNNFINKMYITHTQPQSSVPKSGSVQISSSSAGIASSSSGPMMMLTSGNTNAQMIMSSGHSSMVTGGAGPPSTTTTPAYFAKQSNSIGSGTVANHIAPSFIQNRVVASNTQRLATMDDINDPLLSDILEGVCCMEQEMNIDLLPGESTTTTAACDVIQRSAQPVTSQVNSNCTSSAVDSRNSNEVRSMIMELFDDVINEPEASKVPSTSTSTLDAPLGGDINAKLAISEIQKQLMSLDYPNNTGSVSGNSSSCAVSTMGQPTLVGGPQITNQQYRQMYPPPPAYSATGTIRQVSPGLTNTSGIGAQMGLLSAVQFPTKVIKHRPQPSNVSGGINNASIAATSPNQPMATATAVFAPNGMMQPNPIIIPNQSMMVNGPMSGPPPRMSKTLMERKQKALYQQMQQKQRLLAQQQQQQMTMQTPQHEPPFEPMNEVLLNNTVGPNVAIQPIPRQHSNTQAQLSPQVMNNPPNGPNMIGSFDPITGAPMSPRFKLMSNVIPHSPSPQPSLNAQMMAAQHSPSNQRSHSSASNPQGRGFSPSPSLASSSPHLSTNMTGSLMQTSSPHPYSPASPASGMLPHSNSSANPMQPNLASTAVGSPAGNWSPLPPPILRSSSNAMTAQNLAAQNAAQLANRMQQQNPMLNAQLSQGPVGFITNVTTSTNANNTAPLVSSGTAPNTPQPPNSPSPSLLGNMRYNRNSPVLSGTTTAGPVNNQYPLSPGFHGIHSPATPPMQSQPSQMQSMPNTQQQRTPVRNMPNARMPSSNMPNASGNNSGYFQNASTINSIPGNSFPATQTGYVNSEYVKQELRARVGARSLQNNQIQQQQQQQQQQQSSFGAMSHGGGMSLSSNVPQVRPGSATAVSPIGMFNSNHNNPVGMMSTPMHTNQLGSTLTPEDIDAVVLSFDLSEQMNSTPDSPLFNLGDLTDSPSMVSSSLNRSNSIGRSDASGCIDLNIFSFSSIAQVSTESDGDEPNESDDNGSNEPHAIGTASDQNESSSSQANHHHHQHRTTSSTSVAGPTLSIRSEQQKRSLLQQLLSEPP